MAKKRTNETYRCHCCGVELSSDNCREVSSEFSQSGLSDYCVECESQIYNRFAQTQGKYHALLSACSAFNTPLKPLLLDGVNLDEEPDAWLTYATLLAESGQDRKNGKLLGFADGVTTLWGLFGNDLSQKDFVKRIAAEKEKIAKTPGTELQRERWGTLPIYKGLPLDNSLYQELDRQYEIRATEFRGQTISPQMDDTLIKVAKANVVYDYLMRQGLVKQALDVQKGIDLLLASEEMRKKDAKKQENYSIDSQIVALENAGCMENGKLLPIDKLQQNLFDRFLAGTGKYPNTLDVIHEIIERIWNTLRENAHEQISMDLPSGLQVEDTNGEMQDEKSEEERQNERDTGVTKVSFVDKNGKQVIRARKERKKKDEP